MNGPAPEPNDEDTTDDFYVLGDDDASSPADPAAGSSEQELAARVDESGELEGVVLSGEPGSEDDLLFTPTDEQSSMMHSPQSPYAEDKASEWGGAELSPEGLGIPIEQTANEEGSQLSEAPDQESPSEDLEIEYADGQSSPRLIAIDAESVTHLEAAGASETPESEEPVADAETAAEAEEWAPVAPVDDEIAVGAPVAAAPEASAPEPSEEDHDLVLPHSGVVDAGTHVVGAGTHRRSRMPWLAAAALLIVGCAGALFAHPEWFGLGYSTPEVIERASIPRPAQITPDVPVVAVPDPIDPNPTSQASSRPVDPKPDPRVDPTPPPVDPTPRGEKPPVQLDPLPEQGPLEIGEGLVIQEAAPVTAPDQKRGLPSGIIAGSQAFAQLLNGNFFIGSVKALDADCVTLKLEKGEVTLTITQLKTIVPLASAEFQELKKVEQGYIKLTNRNKLFGTIVATHDENVVLENKANRVVIPRSEVEELGAERKSGVRFTEEKDEAWVDRLIERQLQEKTSTAGKEPPSERGKVRAKADEAEPAVPPRTR